MIIVMVTFVSEKVINETWPKLREYLRVAKFTGGRLVLLMLILP